MAKVSKVDSCMFCGNVPCTCNAKPKAEPKVRAPREPRLNRKCAACTHTQDRHGGDKDCMECDCMAFVPIVRESKTVSIPSSSSGPSQKADITSAMRSAAKVHHVGATTKEDHDATDEITAILADPEFTLAIQAIEPLIHPTERRRFAQVLSAESTPKSRAIVWKRKIAGEDSNRNDLRL